MSLVNDTNELSAHIPDKQKKIGRNCKIDNVRLFKTK